MKKVLIVSPNWLGDAIMAMPAVQLFARQHRNLDITILAKSSVKGIWEKHANGFPVLSFKTGYGDMIQAVREIKSQNFSEVYLLANNFRTALLVYLSGIPVRVGRVHDNRRLLLTDQIWFDSELPRHQKFEYGELLRLPEEELKSEFAELKVDDSCLIGSSMEQIKLTDNQLLIGFIPGAKRGPSKQWPTEHFAELGQKLVGLRHKIVLFGDPTEVELCTTIADKIGAEAINLAGQLSFGQWLAGLKRCDGIVCNDSGGMHISDALAVPLVGIFGITDPGKTGPSRPSSIFLQKSKVRSRAVPRYSEEAVQALKRVTADEVLESLGKLTKRPLKNASTESEIFKLAQ